MRQLAVLAMIALATAGCIGSSAGSTARPSSDRVLAAPWSKTVLTVIYYASDCPPGASCANHIKSFDNRTLVRVTRNLRCDPSGGEYTDAAAACSALRQIVDKLAAKTSSCLCPIGLHPPEKAVGIYLGKRRMIPLDGCSLCGLSGIHADVALLMPGAQG
jgi:hypothetical protein